MTTQTFGETVKAERVKRGWSQQVLANRAEMNRSHIGGIETKPGLPQYATIVSMRCNRRRLTCWILRFSGHLVHQMGPMARKSSSNAA